MFAHFIQYVYNDSTVFNVTTQKTIDTSAPEATQTTSPIQKIPDLPLIYENPDKFFIHFLSKVIQFSRKAKQNETLTKHKLSGSDKLFQKPNANNLFTNWESIDRKVQRIERSQFG